MKGGDNISDGFFLDMELIEKFKSLPRAKEDQWKDCCIYRVPSYMREANPEAYAPKLLSLGPYHHGAAPHLKEMEKHKYRALSRVLKRTRMCVEDFIEALRPLKKELNIDSYNHLDEKWREEEEIEVLATDGVGWSFSDRGDSGALQ
ncbi:hypothetical protein H6P81_014678 [Aristolochia fimbriata]|uniref:Uncharacterized protein n=1 Tax=Aristolochia fimbriata TaxID=158543 RepID=A0AAV7E430_ARIFI|nr:hypothetical protein H6P81_014678 [Aristolochia fimbriata]